MRVRAAYLVFQVFGDHALVSSVFPGMSYKTSALIVK